MKIVDDSLLPFFVPNYLHPRFLTFLAPLAQVDKIG